MDTTTLPLASIGIDIGKEVFHIVGFSADGTIAFRRKIKIAGLTELGGATLPRLFQAKPCPPSIAPRPCEAPDSPAGTGQSSLWVVR
jgi:hypothetical protein